MTCFFLLLIILGTRESKVSVATFSVFCLVTEDLFQSYTLGEWLKTCRYCEGRVTMAAPGFMPLCVTTHTWTYMILHKRRYRVCPIIHCCNSTTPYWITAPPILFYMVPCKEGHLCACNILGKHQPLVKRNISFESYEWALFIKVNLFTNGSGCPGTIVLWRCQKVKRTN